jgi:hypothetical protein
MKPSNPPASPGKQAALVLVGSVALTLAMALVPSGDTAAWLLAPFRWLEIYVHEFGHGVAAMLAGGHFDKFQMWSDSGVATSSNVPEGLPRAFVAAGGLCGPAVVGAIFLAVGRNVRLARLALGGFGAFMAVSLVLWTRTPFGWGFGAVVAALSLLVAFRGSARLAQTLLVFLSVQLALSVYTDRGYLFMQYGDLQNGQHMASDTQHMSDAIGMPYWFWGITCGAFSLLVLLGGLWMYIRPGRTRHPAAAISPSLAAITARRATDYDISSSS